MPEIKTEEQKQKDKEKHQEELKAWEKEIQKQMEQLKNESKWHAYQRN